MTKISKALAVVAALAAGGVLASGTAVAEGYYPDKFKHHSNVLAPSGAESGIPAPYRVR